MILEEMVFGPLFEYNNILEVALFFWEKTIHQIFFARPKNIWKEKTPTIILLASHSVRSFIQKNSFASSARQTSFVFNLNSLTSLQAKKLSGLCGTGAISV